MAEPITIADAAAIMAVAAVYVPLIVWLIARIAQHIFDDER